MKRRNSANKPTDGVAVLPPKRDYKFPNYDLPYEEFVILTEIIREAPRRGCSREMIHRQFEDPLNKETIAAVDAMLKRFEKYGIIRPMNDTGSNVELTRDGYYWTRDQLARFNTDMPPLPKRPKGTSKVTPISRSL